MERQTSDQLTDVKEVPAKDWMTRWSALQVANESTQGIAASALFCEVVAEIERLQRENDTCGLQCSATMRSLLAEVEQLRTTLTGISTCSTCEACRGAALRALGERTVAEINAAVDERLDRVERELSGYCCDINASYPGQHRGGCPAQPPGRPAHEREPPHCSTCSCGMESQQPEGVPARELCSLRQHVLLGFTTDARAEIQWAIARIEDLQRENAALRSANKMNGELLVEAIAHAAVVSTPPPSLTWETFDGMPEPSLDVLKRVAARMRETAPDTAYLAQWAVEQIEEHDQSFDLRWRADMRAIKRWQEAHPGNDLTWPDHADLCVWLLEQLDARAAKPPGDER